MIQDMMMSAWRVAACCHMFRTVSSAYHGGHSLSDLSSGQNTAQGMGRWREFQRFRKIFQAEGEEDIFQILTGLNIWLIGWWLHGTITWPAFLGTDLDIEHDSPWRSTHRLTCTVTPLPDWLSLLHLHYCHTYLMIAEISNYDKMIYQVSICIFLLSLNFI